MRKDYSDGDNPISQLYRYADKIKSGKAVDKDGRMIRVSETPSSYESHSPTDLISVFYAPHTQQGPQRLNH